jgi:hypothetical protein
MLTAPVALTEVPMHLPFNALMLSALLFAVPALADEDDDETSSEATEAPAEETLSASLFLARGSSSLETSFLDSARKRLSDDSSKHYKHQKCTNLELLAAFLSEQGIVRSKDQLREDIQEVAGQTELFLGKTSEQQAWGIGSPQHPVSSEAVALFASNAKRTAEKNCKCKVGTPGSHAILVWSPNGTEGALPAGRRGHPVSTHELTHLVLEHEGVVSVDLHHRFLQYMEWGKAPVAWVPKTGKCAVGATATADEETDDSASEP